MPAVSEPFIFTPTQAAFDAMCDALEEAGGDGGGAATLEERRRALAAYPRRAAGSRVRLRGWRHPYAQLRFDELTWVTGRMRVPTLPATLQRPRVVDPAEGEPAALAVENAGGIVHLGAVYLHSQAPPREPRIVLQSLADARRTRRASVDGIFGRLVPFDADPFTALASAFQNCGAYVEIPAGVRVEAPIQLLWAARPQESSAVFTQSVVRLGAGARATIVERHLGERDGFVAGTVEIDLAEGAELDYVAIQQTGDGTRIAIRRAARASGNGARIAWHVVDFGGALARTALDTQLEAPGSSANTSVIGFARGFTNIDHAFMTSHGPAARSDTVARTMLLDRTRARSSHRVELLEGAAGGVASVHADVLMPGRGTAVAARPAFAVGTDGIAFTQSASLGSLDREQLFYAQSRGIPLRSAERMIALAFYEPAIVRLPSEALRDEIRTELDVKLDEIPETFTS